MRDLLMFGFVMAWLPMALMSGFVAYLLWIFVSLLSPQLYLYGFMSDFRYAFLFAAVALVLITVGRLQERGKFIVDKSTITLLIFVAHAIVSALLAMYSNPLVPARLEIFLKGMALALVTPLFVTSRWRIHAVVIVVVAGLGFHGIVDGAKMLASGGSHNVRGIPGGPLADNNLMAVGMVMLLPLCLYLAKYSAIRLVRWSLFGVFILLVLAVLGTHSRGGFIALSIVGFWYWLTSRRKLVSGFLIAVLVVGVTQYASESWFERISTIKEADEDASFLGRVAAWKVSVNVANGSPFFGGGFDATQVPWIWDSNKSLPNLFTFEIPENFAYKAAHSIYFQVLGELGYVGLALFLTLLLMAFITRWQVHLLTRRLMVNGAWAADLSTAITLSLVAFMAGGGGVSIAYFEIVYLQIVLLSIIRSILAQEVNGSDSSRELNASHNAGRYA